MYKISVPIQAHLIVKEPEGSLKELRRFNPDRIFTCCDNAFTPDEKIATVDIENVRQSVEILRKNGFADKEIGIWTLSFSNNRSERSMVTLEGNQFGFGCPSDPVFTEQCKNRVKALAKTGVDIIMLDDDLRYGFLGSQRACLCKNHLKFICDEIGEELTAEEISPLIASGGKNKYRDAFLHANGYFLERYASELRSALDEVDPTIRLGYSACLTSWDFDGTDVARLSKIFAGNTAPFARGIGAPYWSRDKLWGNELQDAIELERMESVWTRSSDLEFFTEGDTYPRPRHMCSAARLEIFDTALRASGATDGILKYGLDYCSNPDYETTYATYHERNTPLYAEIDKYFGGKSACGVRVYEAMNKIADVKNPNELGGGSDLQSEFFSRAARALAACTIPTTYEGDGVGGIIFGENARHFGEEACENGLILDILAAKILSDKGIDVGLKSVGAEHRVDKEHFIAENNDIMAMGMATYDVELDERAEVLSEGYYFSNRYVLSYRYENAKGQKFLVLNMNPANSNPSILHHYARSRQYAEAIKWFTEGKGLPAYCYGNPKMYTLCKESEKALAVGLWNIFDDIAFEPVVELAESYSEINCINCTGRLDGNKVYLSDIPAFTFAGFEVIK